MAKMIPLLIAFFFAVIPIFADESFSGKVVTIADGDTIRIFNQNENKQYKIRLFGIDAPEKKQDYGKKSKDALSDLIFGKNVQITVKGIDQYKRVLGVVLLGNSEINLEMVKNGHAWVYRKYHKSKNYIDAENLAKSNKIGLWRQENPTPPWDYRKNEKSSKRRFFRKVRF